MAQKKGNKNKSALGIAIWILAFLIILLVFLVKQEEIKTNLQKVNFFERLFGSTPAFITEHKVEEKKSDFEENTVIDLKKNEVKKAPEPVKTVEKKAEEKKPEPVKTETKIVDKTEAQPEQKKTVPVETKKEEAKVVEKSKPAEPVKTVEKEPLKTSEPVQTKVEEVKTEPPKPATIAAKICFVAIDREGPIVRKEVTRNVEKDSPLTNSILSMLKGPTPAEEKNGCRSLIPAGTKLYSVSVKNGVATMNFSEEFEFNQYGVEGYLGQLMQIVYTATNYSTVKSVQILIEGQKKEYLGSEGVWIGSPLTRASFR
ncbi:MAG: GerMN domain-containing protein [Treponema sp.]|nr:GerMN domain-containing protein [Candidatus Treponema equifaecale]